MAIPDYQTLMLPVLVASARGEISVGPLSEEIANEFQLTDEERSQLLPSGRQRLLHNRVHWAKFYLQKAKLVQSPRRGVWTITDTGRQLLASNPSRIDNDLLLKYPSFAEFMAGSTSGGRSEESVREVQKVVKARTTPEEQIDSAYEALQSALKGDLIARVLDNSPGFFEDLIVDLLVAMGYGGTHQNAAARLGRSGDGGVDGIINEDRLGLDRVYIQAKRWAREHQVGRPDVQSFVGSLVGLGASKGVFVTTSTFSAPAIEFADRLPQRIVLIDGSRLADLMTEHNVGVRINRAIEFKRIDEDYFTEGE